jgi:hypothetical protein
MPVPLTNGSPAMLLAILAVIITGLVMGMAVIRFIRRYF